MIELVKKAMFTGVGMVALTKDKIEEVSREFVDKGKLSEEEGRKLMDELLSRSEESKQVLKEQIEASVKSVLDKMDIPTKSDIQKLQDELTSLRQMIESNE
ncbi:MAG: hypothetical protein D6B25_12125 [Desulfobulbaceae bacterium]|nr:MAG: hypothetical protein D6B25_12125 [Desulfobulbaceae bacterium]